MKPFRPMLASTWDIANLQDIPLPVYVSKKFDGIRAVTAEASSDYVQFFSRTGKLIRNRHVQKWARNLPSGLDGELLVWQPNELKFLPFEDIESAIMSASGEPDFVYMVFDYLTNRFLPFRTRYASLQKWERAQLAPWASRLQLVEQILCEEHSKIRLLLDNYLEDEHEGAMVRDPYADYKHGRATGIGLSKLKPWFDDEAKVFGIEEQLQNCNPEKRNEIGYMKRSQAKSGLSSSGTMGKLICRSRKFGEFALGTGFTASQRNTIWDSQEEFLGRTLTFRYRSVTAHGKPRSPSFVRFKKYA